MKILKIKPFFSEKIWGTKNWDKLGFKTDKNKTIGEAWVISAHRNGMTFLEINGISLLDYFERNKYEFNINGKYPMLSKIISANDYLSVQVHPNDEYAFKEHKEFGKPESWYIIDCPKNAELIYGHNAKTSKELKTMIKDNQWNNLLKRIKIKKGDFIYVPPGKIHAITPNVTVFELQRSSDVTYRLYDFDRLEKGKPRRLDIKDSVNVISVPDSKEYVFKNAKGNIFNSEYFSIYIFDALKEKQFDTSKIETFLQMTVIDGTGLINGIKFEKGESAIIVDKLETLNIKGTLKIIFSWI